MDELKHSNAVPACYSRIGDDLCTGCAACANGCHRSAIKMELNREGFYRPLLRSHLCDNCMVCLEYCPILVSETPSPVTNDEQSAPEIYAAWSNDEEIHLTSSSGGIFSELARHVLENGGAVCGCEWGENWTPQHAIVRDWSDIPRLRGSKYIPSFVGENFYREVIALARAGTQVLFCGTPCQVAGLARIAPPEARVNILLVDLVCHGVPSLKSFWDYLDWKFGGRDKLEYFSFRNKEITVQTLCAIRKNGIKYLAAAGNDPWFRMVMINHWYLQRCCFGCPFGDATRSGDITLGDFWGIPEKWHNPKGDSVVLANTVMGKRAINHLIKLKCIRVQTSDYVTASRKIRRLRGAHYLVPFLRAFSLYLVASGKSFAWVYYLCYLPLRFMERVKSYPGRIFRLLCKPLQALWNRC